MYRRTGSFLLACILLFCAFSSALADAVVLNPPAEWWGVSKTAFAKAYPDEEFTEIDVKEQKALVLPSVAFSEDLTLDMYFCFFRKEAGKSYYGLSEILYLIPLETGRFTDAQLNSRFKTLQKIITAQNGKADRTDTNTAVWDFEEYTITLAAKSYKDFTGSTKKTVGVTYSRADAAAAAAKGGSAKNGALTVSAKASCGDYNHVGEKWSFVYYVNKSKITDGKTMSFAVGDTVTVSASITEEDSNPDVGSGESTHVITAEDLEKGFQVRFTVSVQENGGRYKGSAARWYVTFTFEK